MQEDTVTETGETMDGPPASNLRKSNRTTSVETNVVIMGEKTGCNGVAPQVGSVKKSTKQRKKGPIADGNTPSVRDWVRSSDENLDFHGDWSLQHHQKRRIQRQGQEGYDSETDGTSSIDHWENGDPWQTRNPPQEEWDKDEGGDGDRNHRRGNPLLMGSNRQRQTGETDETAQLGDSDGEVTFNRQQKEEENLDKELDELIEGMEPEGVKNFLKIMCQTVREMQKTIKDDKVKLTKRIKAVEEKNILLSKVAVKHDGDIQTSARRINNVELRNTRNNLIVSGIKEAKGEKCKELADAFFKNQLLITKPVAIRSAWRLGATSDQDRSRDLMITLEDVKDKSVIHKHVKNLKGIKNSDGKEYFVNDHLPPEQAELSRHKKNKVKINKTLIDAQQQAIEWKRGELIIDGREYKPKVIEPTCTDIIEMKQADLEKALKFKMFATNTERMKNGSKFLGFAAKVHSLDDVVNGYRQLKYRFIDATHVICAYRIMDPDVAHMTDCIDGGELGAGRRLLQMLIDNSHANIAVFVVRYHRGPNIGPSRFNLIIDAAKEAITAIPPDISRLIGVYPEQPNFSLFSNPVRMPIGRGNMHNSQKRYTDRARGATAAARALFPDKGNSPRTHPLTSVQV